MARETFDNNLIPFSLSARPEYNPKLSDVTKTTRVAFVKFMAKSKQRDDVETIDETADAGAGDAGAAVVNLRASIKRIIKDPTVLTDAATVADTAASTNGENQSASESSIKPAKPSRASPAPNVSAAAPADAAKTPTPPASKPESPAPPDTKATTPVSSETAIPINSAADLGSPPPSKSATPEPIAPIDSTTATKASPPEPVPEKQPTVVDKDADKAKSESANIKDTSGDDVTKDAVKPKAGCEKKRDSDKAKPAPPPPAHVAPTTERGKSKTTGKTISGWI